MLLDMIIRSCACEAKTRASFGERGSDGAERGKKREVRHLVVRVSEDRLDSPVVSHPGVG